MAKAPTTKSKFGFLDEFNKSTAKMEGVVTTSAPPRYWHSFGNYLMNAIMAGDYQRGHAQGRITGIVGPSGAGKSFIIGNSIREAQRDGALILVIDSENALDDDYMTKIGVEVGEENGYYYRGVRTISQVTAVVSSFIKNYRKEFGTDEDAPKVFIAIDSLDMLMTDTELDHYNSGDQKGDQGQRAKQIKAMLRTFVQDIKELNVTMAVTGQVYKNQDIKNGEGVWVVNDAVKYSLSQIIMVTKLKLKEGSGMGAEVTGIRLRANGYKTRFTKPFQAIELEVPYDDGIDPFSGLLEAAVSQKLVTQGGAWYTLNSSGAKFQRKNFSEHQDQILKELSESKNPLMAVSEEEEDTTNTTRKSAVQALLENIEGKGSVED